MASEETSYREPNNSWSLREKRRGRERREKGEGIERGRGERKGRGDSEVGSKLIHLSSIRLSTLCT